MTKCLLLVLLLAGVSAQMFTIKQWAAGQAHDNQINSVKIYNDNSKFVSSCNTYMKVWSMTDFSLLHTFADEDTVVHVSLHPVDNRIFVFFMSGAIRVLDPQTYEILHAGSYPTGGGNGNFIQFFSSNSKYVVSGYDNNEPIIHIFDSTTYALIAGGPTTIFTAEEQTTVMSVSKDGQLLAAISTEWFPNHLLIYNLDTNTLVRSFMDNFSRLKWVSFSPFLNQLYLVTDDQILKIYKINPFTGQYDAGYSYPINKYGYPTCINANIKDQLVFSADRDIVFLNISKTDPVVMFSDKDVAYISVFDLSLDGKYLVSGMEDGEMTVWQINSQTPKKDSSVSVFVILGACIGAVALATAAGFLIHRCCCKPNGSGYAEKDQVQRKQYNQQTDECFEYGYIQNNTLGIAQ